MNARIYRCAVLIAALSMVFGCRVSLGDEAGAGDEVMGQVMAAMDCDERLMEMKALSASRPAEETYRQLDELLKGNCSTHQELLEQRFIIGSSYRIGATPDELIQGIDWRSSTNREFLWALSLAGIKKNLASPSPEDVLDHFADLAPSDFLPRILRARLYQQRDDIGGVDRELKAATERLGAKKSDVFQIERSQLAPIYFLEGRTAEAYEMSMEFVRLYGEEAWSSPDMIGIAAMSAIDVGKPHEAKQLLDELHRRNRESDRDPAVQAARSEMALKHPELL